MLTWLQRAQVENYNNAQQLHRYWHQLMEEDITRNGRNSFFSEVVTLANEVSHCAIAFCIDPHDF